MGNFFHCWRRKTGCVTLAVALVLTCGWVRSFFVADIFLLTFPRTFYEVASDRFGISLYKRTWVDPDIFLEWARFPQMQVQFHPGVSVPRRVTGRLSMHGPLSNVPAGLRWEFCGFYFGKGPRPGKNGCIDPGHKNIVTKVIVPYWSVVLPLTVLSAYLLLMKPEKVKGTINGLKPTELNFLISGN